MDILNSLGQIISVPVDQDYPAGKFDTNLDFSIFKSGIYFYQFHINGEITPAKKIVVE
jgi:hypothetical protein